MAGNDPLLGKVTWRYVDVDANPLSTLRLGPDGLTQTMVFPFEMTFERYGDVAGPLAFRTRGPATFISGPLAQFPPPPLRTAPDGTVTGGALLTAPQPISFTTTQLPGGPLPDLSNLQMQGPGVLEGSAPR
ncbi:hypothetical protein [Streptomyces sp. MNP-20]|uniref:hypothetical protein n=1 Tax=Streptomyces sp. MNP-20 TaxID=2721165 RepID=UPI001556907F|nr:hypothetical protein [Streptomyces sp. MNP-20]